MSIETKVDAASVGRRASEACLHLGVGPAGDLADHVVYSILHLEGDVVPGGNQLAFGILCRKLFVWVYVYVRF